ncbi:unnamed protein product [Orchesella dallaii]|uniref:Gamma-secretase subunit Aph-1 n=1 Tax=Orchesella dallaii TaxID=48710 RepID=A0ABP1QPW4_9HEXA
MTVMEFFGCTFIAFGPPFAMFYYTIAHDPIRIIILIASAFFWLLSLLLSSIWWAIVTPLKETLVFAVVSSVIFQEVMRFLVYLLLTKAEGGLKRVTETNTSLVDNKHVLAYVSGLGFGIMSGAFALINILADSVGPGTVGLRRDGDSPMFFVTSAITTLCFILLHSCWNVTFYAGVDRRNYGLIAIVFVSHLVASLLTLLNKNHLYWVSILPNYFNLILSAWFAFRVAGGRLKLEDIRRTGLPPVTLNVAD